MPDRMREGERYRDMPAAALTFALTMARQRITLAEG